MQQVISLLVLVLQARPINTACEPNRVGHDCNYKCHCYYSSRCQSAPCRPDDKCESPYFGFYCQYVNILKECTNSLIFADDDIGTCYETIGYTLDLTFNSTYTFAFINIQVQNFDIITETYKRNNLTIHFKLDHDVIECVNQEIWEISRTEIEIRCVNQTIFFKELTLTGSVKYICELRLSGGRSAGTDLTVMSPNPIKDNLKASINGILNDPVCFMADNWDLTLSRPFIIQRIKIHSKPVQKRKAQKKYTRQGFSLQFIDETKKTTFSFRTNTSEDVYDIATNSSPKVLSVIIEGPGGGSNIVICEAEIFGDCPPGWYGLDCGQKCRNCPEGRCSVHGHCYMCIYEMGHVVCRQQCQGCKGRCTDEPCTGQCKDGYKGDHCLNLCANCGGTGECDKVTGNCVSPCVGGFMGATCSQDCGYCAEDKCDQNTGNCTECKSGFFGHLCNRKCHQCKEQKCHHETGNCVAGCHDGYRGSLCFLRCSNCAGSQACNQTTGECHEGCVAGFTACGHCSEKQCDRISGNCIHGTCLPGYAGSRCNQECTYCIDHLCDAQKASCLKGCQNGYYGTNCLKPCPNCAGSRACERYNGKCVSGCSPGFHGDTCIDECGHCDRDKSCEKQSGNCKYGCLPGFTGVKCVDHKNDLEDSQKFTVFIFYAVFLSIIGITLIVLFFSQKIYWFCSSDARESFEIKIREPYRGASVATTSKSSGVSTGRSSSADTQASSKSRSRSSSVDDIATHVTFKDVKDAV
ncbi:uncharacterized protein LOC106063980 isoform X2 [Biomphalaria glabrata]|uniref:Uncharacterized protein LOC106063980 isoform X2 n=1 Tax=Biomphalaria glabrata TaxID=6526 RepID=A0A9W3ACT5_BIOGL|nr:uncharacterized protein LOC106063980 isoform X2 [Biomphalaria glabrata]